jgi:hypothetical protein
MRAVAEIVRFWTGRLIPQEKHGAVADEDKRTIPPGIVAIVLNFGEIVQVIEGFMVQIVWALVSASESLSACRIPPRLTLQ